MCRYRCLPCPVFLLFFSFLFFYFRAFPSEEKSLVSLLFFGFVVVFLSSCLLVLFVFFDVFGSLSISLCPSLFVFVCLFVCLFSCSFFVFLVRFSFFLF